MSEAERIAAEVPALVRRSYAGDQNAMADLYLIGQRARKGDKRARYSYQLIEKYAKEHPPEEASFVRTDMPQPIIMETPEGGSSESAIEVHGDDLPTVMPRGTLDGICDPEHFAERIVNASRYRYGIDAAAVVLAAGKPLTVEVIEDIAENDLGPKESEIFLYGVRRCTADDWDQTAPHLNSNGQKYLTLGQCFGRARRLQALRHPRTRISQYAPVLGWELGE
jgi:hypothetical protein